jgi:TolA-binding protein
MKKLFIFLLISISFISCNAQSAEVAKLKEQVVTLQGNLDSVLTQIDTIKFLYDYKISKYSDTVLQMKGQIEGLEVMLAECPDSNLVNDLQDQISILQVQIANMKIVEQESYNTMLEYQKLSDRWLELWKERHPEAEIFQ